MIATHLFESCANMTWWQKVYYKSDNVKDVEHWALNMPWRAT